MQDMDLDLHGIDSAETMPDSRIGYPVIINLRAKLSQNVENRIECYAIKMREVAYTCHYV